MKTYLNSLRIGLNIEIAKYKRTYALSLAVLAPAFLATVIFLVYFFRAEAILKGGTNGWSSMINYGLQFSTSLLFPLFIILLVVFIHNLEHKNSGQRLNKILPLPQSAAYISKLSVSLGLLLTSILLFDIFINLGAWINAYKYPDLFHFDISMFSELGIKTANIVLCSFFMFAIQYLVSLKFSNIIIPIGIGFAGFISALILIQGWEHIDYHPYALFMLVMGSPAKKEIIRQLIFYSLAGGLITLLVGFLHIRFKKLFT